MVGWAAAWQAIRSGRPDEAERLGRAALQSEPESAEGWFLLGAACHCQGRVGEAADGYAHALRLRPDYPEVHYNLGNALLDQGLSAEAADCFRQALRLRPDYPEALVDLGIVLRSEGRPAEAAECYTRALRQRPDCPQAQNNLGNVLLDLGRPVEAAECFARLLQQHSDDPQAHNNFGNALLTQGRSSEAESCFRRALALRPDYPEALNNLGNALRALGRRAQAAECYTHALRLRPDLPETHNNLGIVLSDLGRPAEAAECCRRALRLRPVYPEAHNNLGIALRDLGRPGEAIECYTRALQLRSNDPDAHNNLGNALRELGRLSEAEAHFQSVLTIRPDDADTHNNLGIALRDQGRPDEAEKCFRRSLELRPDFPVAHDSLLMTLHYRATVTPQDLAAAHAEYQRRHAAPLRALWRPFANDRDPERPLRLGLVSPDFGRHPVGYLVVRAVEALARRECAVVCYSDRRAPPDELTARFRAAACHWRDTAGLTDEQLAEQVRADGIDVLIDLAGHTAGNRLLAFAHRPAPVQVTWLGYEGTTGLEAVDYLIADERLIPPGADIHYCERVLRLPGGYASFDPPEQAPEPGPVPALTNARVTFGCFNNPAKLSAPALAAFAEVLQRVPGSRLVLQYRGLDDPAVAGRLRTQFAAYGVGPERVDLRGASSHAHYLSAYREVDVVLDPFPFAGGVTTCDALWMGVPVVTLPGETFASRHGLSYLAAVRLMDLAAVDVEGYASLAAGLARDLDRLADLRAGLRQRMARSPLCDGERLAGELLAALGHVWREWATGSGPAAGDR